MAFDKVPGLNFKVMVTTARSKVKSRLHHEVAHLEPPTNVSTKYQLPTLHRFPHIARTRYYKSRSLQQGQKSNQDHTMMFHTVQPLSNDPAKYQLPNFTAFAILHGQNCKVRVTLTRSKVTSRSHHDVAHLQPPTKVPTKYHSLHIRAAIISDFGATVAEWEHSRLPPLRPGFDYQHGLKWESW